MPDEDFGTFEVVHVERHLRRKAVGNDKARVLLEKVEHKAITANAARECSSRPAPASPRPPPPA
jgi:hypothetical protein